VNVHGKKIVMVRNQKRVLKEYPNAKCTLNDNGEYIIVVDDVILAEEYFLPPAYDTLSAWANAALACKTTQNFNRTHPLRMDLTNIEDKLLRMEKRKKRGKNDNV
jgi:hypothetical protein